MMIFISKFILYFILSFAILSIPIKHTPFFDHLYSFTSPYSISLFQLIKKNSLLGYKKGKIFISNTLPKSEDKINSISSAPSRQFQNSSHYIPQDEYTAEEKAMLERILIENSKNGR